MSLDEFANLAFGLDFGLDKRSEPNVGGRPHIQSDEWLSGSLNLLVGAFEEGWCRIGWALTRIREARELQTIQSVRDALVPVSGPGRGVICILVSETVRMSDQKELSRLRKRYEETDKARMPAREATSRQLDSWREAYRAVSQATPEQRAVVIAAKQERARECFRLRREQRQLETQLNDLETELRPKEAFFAQTEALDFLRQNRHEISPRNLAAALADLPYTHWETSHRRCSQIGCTMLEHPFYSAFRAICYLIEHHRPSTDQDAILMFRAQIPKLPQTEKQNHVRGKTFLAAHFVQLRKAVEEVWHRCPSPRRLVYDLTAALVENLTRETDADRVLGAEEELPI